MLPPKLHLVALMGRPIFPGIFTPIMIGNPPDLKVVEDAVAGDGMVGLVMLKNEADSPSIEDLHRIGSVAKIVKKINLPDGGMNIFISTFKRFRIKKALRASSPIVAAVEYLDDEEDSTSEVKALTRALISEMKQISENNPLFSEEMRLNMINIDHPGKIADFIASILNIDKDDQQKVLETLNVRKRMEQVLVFIKKEQELLRIQKKIQRELNEKIEKSQREYFLKEELKAIKAELGMAADAKGSEHRRLQEKLDALALEGEAKEAVEQELEKFGLMEPNSAEFVVTRNYLDAIASLPWRAPLAGAFSMARAREILEEDHYGLGDVKSRIAEYLAVLKLRSAAAAAGAHSGRGGAAAKGAASKGAAPKGAGSNSAGSGEGAAEKGGASKGGADSPGGAPKGGGASGGAQADRAGEGQPAGSIVCLVGPPGVGKTSVGRSIARALGRQFFRFSVGGMRDEAEIKGHRRTYIGAMPGKIIQGLRISGARDPVFMIDEIDKMGSSFQGDPASALLEALDPEQNGAFRDHYLDLPFDISNIFFIVTANTLDTIPAPLLDRMEVIQLPGYIDAEKLEIARRYLIPKSLERSGLGKGRARYTRDSLLHIANAYAREAGVRGLEKSLDKIHRKLAKQIVEEEEAAEASAQPGSGGGAGCAAGAGAGRRRRGAAALSSAPESEGAPAKGPASKSAGKGAAPGGAAPGGEASDGGGEAAGGPGAPAQGGRARICVDRKLVEKHLGRPAFPEGDEKRASFPGMCLGLAWTSLGGETLVIEAVSSPGKEGLTLTGSMGDTMKESAAIAMTVARKLAAERYGMDAQWLEKNHVHLHIPEGATPKDGPSAGITMATALLSLMLGRTVADRLAMTGELSLTGSVLPIGGLKEKTIAARRNKARRIIIPRQNERDLDEIPGHVKKGISFHPVSRFEEVLRIALPD